MPPPQPTPVGFVIFAGLSRDRVAVDPTLVAAVRPRSYADDAPMTDIYMTGVDVPIVVTEAFDDVIAKLGGAA